MTVFEHGTVSGTCVSDFVGSFTERFDAFGDLLSVVTGDFAGWAKTIAESVREVTQKRGGEFLVKIDHVSGRVPRRVIHTKTADFLPVFDGANRKLRERKSFVVQSMQRFDSVASGPRRKAVPGDGGYLSLLFR